MCARRPVKFPVIRGTFNIEEYGKFTITKVCAWLKKGAEFCRILCDNLHDRIDFEGECRSILPLLRSIRADVATVGILFSFIRITNVATNHPCRESIQNTVGISDSLGRSVPTSRRPSSGNDDESEYEIVNTVAFPRGTAESWP